MLLLGVHKVVTVDVCKPIHSKTVDDVQNDLHSCAGLQNIRREGIFVILCKQDMQEAHEDDMTKYGKNTRVELTRPPRVHEEYDEIHPDEDKTKIREEQKSFANWVDIKGHRSSFES